MRLSRRNLENRRRLGRAFTRELAPLLPLMLTGQAGLARCRSIADALEFHDAPTAGRVVERLLTPDRNGVPRIIAQQAATFSQSLHRAVLASVSPDEAKAKGRAARRALTGVEYLRADDALGVMRVTAPVEQIEAVRAVLKSEAAIVRPLSGDERTIGQRRVDFLIDRVTGVGSGEVSGVGGVGSGSAMAAGQTGEPATGQTGGPATGPAAASVIPRDDISRRAEEPPVPGDVTPRHDTLDPEVSPPETTDWPSDAAPDVTPDVTPEAAPEAALREQAARRAGRVNIGVIVTASAESLLGLSNEPGLVGTTPVHADDIRDITQAPDWVRVALLNERGIVVNLGRKQRFASPLQRIALGARQITCSFPGCAMPAVGCDVDHVTAWADGGRTDLDELEPLCGRHHHLKHQCSWRVEVVDDGVQWTTPHDVSIRVDHVDHRPPPGPHDAGDFDAEAQAGDD